MREDLHSRAVVSVIRKGEERILTARRPIVHST